MSTESVIAPTTTPSASSSTPSSSHQSSGSSVQMKRALEGKPLDVQMAMLRPVQRHGEGGGTDHVHEAAAAGIASGGGTMPHADKIQASFGGFDVGNIQAHTGSEASKASQAMGAEAYATGDHVVFGGAPDLHTAAHEAAHVVQQQAGVSLSGGVGQAGDKYEQHADKVADAVVAGKPAEGLLGEMTGGAPVQQKSIQKSVQRRSVQRVSVVQRDDAGSPPADPDVDLATIKSELATAASAGPLGQFTPAEATALAARIAPSGAIKRSTLDTEKTGAHTKLVSAWSAAEAANPRGFCGAYAGPDAIAARKFGELDGEVDTNYDGGSGAAAKASFYQSLAGILAAGNVTRMNVFGKCDAAVRNAGLRMRGKAIDNAQMQPLLHRTAGVSSTFNYTSDKAAIAADMIADPVALTPALRALTPADLLARYPNLVKEYWISKGGAYAKSRLVGNLTPPNGGTWFSSGAVTLAPAPGDTQFAQLMEIGALQPEWFADGACKFTISSARIPADANCRKPTCLDGMQSGLFVPNNSPNSFGTTGGGYNEFLGGSIPAAAVDSMEIISTSVGLQTEIQNADAAAKAAGHGSAMDQQERERAGGRPAPGAGGAQGVYDAVTTRTAQERTTPTALDPVSGQRR